MSPSSSSDLKDWKMIPCHNVKPRFSYQECFDDGTEVWRNNQTGKIHREGDLPAVIKPNGTKAWFLEGLLHRENNEDGKPQPAIECSNGVKRYYRFGRILVWGWDEMKNK